MKANYKNWMPVSMIVGVGIGFLVSIFLLFFQSFCGFLPTVLKTFFGIFFFVTTCALGISFVYCIIWHNIFSYDGKRKLAKHIIEGLAPYVQVPEGGEVLDIGCGSGALTIEIAKLNPSAHVTGVDMWGRGSGSFSKRLCYHNAEAEGVKSQCSFHSGDAKKLKFEDESFDAIASNYCYHNIPGVDKQELMLESLRTLKKGGSFTIHDIMSTNRYGDMEEFAQSLRDAGYAKVELIDTTQGMFMSPREANLLALAGSTILCGIK